MGAGILDKAMELYPALDFESYDRMFPNQDHMPAGGFGNLIALPYKKHARALEIVPLLTVTLMPLLTHGLFYNKLN